ncbi:RICIN domain-containing protein [Bacteriovoracales bacterium]|nr:RICIN domain-containing protein [Bacteriovoracales bacterium]
MKSNNLKKTFIFVLTFWIGIFGPSAFTEEETFSTVNFTDGLIPLNYGKRPATDLYHKGKLLVPDEADRLVREGRGFDLSRLNPDETTVLWKDKRPENLETELDEMAVDSIDPVWYTSTVPSRSGNFRFTIEKEGDQGGVETFVVMMSKTIHNLLLRKNLLRKLGYNVPPVKYLKNLKLNFSNPFEKEIFFNELAEGTFGDPARWVKRYRDHLRGEDRIENEEERRVYRSFSEVEKLQLIVKNSSLCLARSFNRSGELIQEKCENPHQVNWVLEKQESHEDEVVIRSAVTGKCLDLKKKSRRRGIQIIEMPCDKGRSQIFRKIRGHKGFWLKSVYSQQCLEIEDHSKKRGAALIQNSCRLNGPQKWKSEEGISFDGPLADAEEIELQDVVAMSSQDHYYNLSLGYLPPSVIQGRRLLNSLLIPYALVEVPESVNMLPWHMARVINKQLKVEFENAENFSTTFDDAKWITRRILSLSRNDWREIVKLSHFPKEVELLLVEKFISRRNQLKKSLQLSGTHLEFNPSISYGRYLDNGKLLKENWYGYASRFSFGDPESPLSKSEVGHFIASKVVSTSLEGITNYVSSKFLNNQYFLERAFKKKQQELYEEAVIKFLQTGVPQNIPIGVFAYPTVGANIGTSRDVVIGSYLGTDNQVQMADSLIFSVDIGAFASVYGLPALINVNGAAKAAYTRSYSHLRPIKSFKASFKYPFKNMIVPYFKRNQGKKLAEILSVNLKDLSAEERQKKITEAVKSLKENIPVGDSLLITDNIAIGASGGVGVGVGKIVDLGVNSGQTNLVVSRLHIHRKDENTIQIYKDLGNVHGITLSFGAKAIAPLLNLSYKWGKGKTRGKFYSLKIKEDEGENPEILKNLHALKGLFLKNSLEGIKALTTPYQVTHRFTESLKKAGFTFLKLAGLKAKTEIEVTHPEGAKKLFYKTSQVARKGTNPTEYGIDALNGIFTKYTEWDIQMKNISAGAPGDSIGGMQVIYNVSYEGEIKNKKKVGLRKKGGIEDPFVKISKSFRGWSISNRRAQKIIRKLNSQYQTTFYPELSLHQTEKIFLYNIGVDHYIYSEGIKYLSSLSKRDFKRMIKKGVKGPGKLLKRARMISHFKKLKAHLEKNNYKSHGKYTRSVISMANRWLNLEGFKDILGGSENFFIISRIDGFRIGDEAGDTRINSNSLGQIGDKKVYGPLMNIMMNTGMTASEFYAYWLRGRLN